jgi:hypothetical protein
MEEFNEMTKASTTSSSNIWTTPSSGNSNIWITPDSGTGNFIYNTTSGIHTIPLSIFSDSDDSFIRITKHLSEEDIVEMLRTIKSILGESIYIEILNNLIKFPAYRLMSDEFLISHFDDIKKWFLNLRIDMETYFELNYGVFLEQLTGFRLLLKLE